MRTVTWVIKSSKFCNLRCSYCYEWDELANRERMAIDTWKNLFRAVVDYNEFLAQRLGSYPNTHIVWHGGEPLLLPLSYIREVQSLLREKLERVAANNGARVTTSMQTNLFNLTDDMIALLREERISIGVSFDGVKGVRVSVSGKTTEERVLTNVRRLQAAGLRPGGICVVAKHTAPHLRQIYDLFASMDMPMRVLPLFSGPDSRPLERFDIDDQSIADAISDLFDYWLESGASISVRPLQQWLENAIKQILRLEGPVYDRRLTGEYVLVVNTDGHLYQARDPFNVSLSIGNVNASSVADILASVEYRRSLERDDLLRKTYCASCDLYRKCDGYPLFSGAYLGNHQGRCSIAYPVQKHIAKFLIESGFDEVELRGMLRGHLSVSSTSQVQV